MITGIYRLIVKFWLRKYKKQTVIPSVRAVFLGDNLSTEVLLKGVYERYELEALARSAFPHVPRDSYCLDIGANIGNHTNSFAPHFKKIYAFEPNPVVQLILRANTFGKNVEVVECGVSNEKKYVPFAQDFANLGASRITDDGATATRTIQVDRLDDIATRLGLSNVSFVKIDVEGHELQAIEGGACVFEARATDHCYGELF